MANLCLKLENHHHAGNPKIMMNISCPLFQIDWVCVQALVVVPVSVPMPWVPASVDAFVVCSNSQMDLHLMCSSFFQMVHMASGTVSGATYTLFCYCCCLKGLTIINNDLNWTIERIENEWIKKRTRTKISMRRIFLNNWKDETYVIFTSILFFFHPWLRCMWPSRK